MPYRVGDFGAFAAQPEGSGRGANDGGGHIEDPIDIRLRDVEVCDSTKQRRTVASSGHPYAVRFHLFIELLGRETRSRDVEKHDVGFDLSRIEVDARDLGEATREELGVLVVLRQALDVMLQRVNAACSNNAGLPHRATKHLLVAAGTFDRL